MSEPICTCHCGGSMFYRHMHAESCELSRVGEEAPKSELEQLRDEVARLTKLKEAFAKTTKGNITINRYEHGGGRMFVDDGKNRDLIADTYNEGDREFIALCYEAFAALTPQAGKGGGE